MSKKEIAIISDIHGNSYALEAVLANIQEKGIKTIINLGDSLYGPLDPRGTLDMLIDTKIKSISGNQDRFIIQKESKKFKNKTLEAVRSAIKKKGIEWLSSLDKDLIYKDIIYCCHGTPHDDSEYLLEKIADKKLILKKSWAINEMLLPVEQNIILCGHSHTQNFVDTGEKIVINPGSVGLPAYTDGSPIHHRVESHSPYAKYSVLTLNSVSHHIDQVSVIYNYEKAARLAEKNGREDWAAWLRNGRAE